MRDEKLSDTCTLRVFVIISNITVRKITREKKIREQVYIYFKNSYSIFYLFNINLQKYNLVKSINEIKTENHIILKNK